MAIFDDNVRLLGELFGNQEYTERGSARTSRLDANEQPEADPSTGLPAGYIWVRRDGSRNEVRALIGAGMYRWERIGNLPVEVGINRSGELEAIKPLVNVETAYTHGTTLTTAPAQSLYLESKQFTPGLVTADAVGGYGLSVYVQPLPYRATVIEGAVSVSSSVPGTTGQRRLAVIFYDVSAAALGVANGTVTLSAAPFTLDDAVAIALGDTDRIRLGAVELAYGQTSITASNKFIDCRDWLTLHENISSTSLPNFGAAVTKTLSSDVASAGSDRNLVIAAESSTTDNLIEITGLNAGDEVVIRADAGDTITVKHNDAGATDKILLYNATDLALSGDQTLKLVKVASGKVMQYVDEKGSSGGGGGTNWGAVYSLTPVVLTDFTWVNQGSASATQQGDSVYLSVTNGSGEALRILKKAAPATPYTVTAALIGIVYPNSSVAEMGIGWRENSSGNLVVARHDYSGTVRALSVTKHNNTTAGVAHYVVANTAPPATVFWWRLEDDGTNRKVYFSNDGVNFLQYHSVGRTDYLTADEIGFFVGGNSSAFVGMTLLSWEEA